MSNGCHAIQLRTLAKKRFTYSNFLRNPTFGVMSTT